MNMDLIRFDLDRCDLCGACIKSCPFGALSMGAKGIEVGEDCRMCGICVRGCAQHAISFEQKARTVNKNQWRDFLIFAEQERGHIHPVAFELIGEAQKMAVKVGYQVNCVVVGGPGSAQNARELLPYGVNHVYVYEHPGFEGFRADCYTDAVADCIAKLKPSAVLIGATALGRSLAPRLSTRYHTGLTADCTSLDIRKNTDLVQIRPAFGGNIMAQILINDSRPQFATVRYRVMDRAKRVEQPSGDVILCPVTERMTRSRIDVLSVDMLEEKLAIEDAERIVAVGRGVRNEEGLAVCRALADALGAQLAVTRPMVEQGMGDQLHQIGLSGHTVRPKLIVTCGVSGAIQFTSCMQGADTIVAVNSDPEARIFGVANYCIVDDLYEAVPRLTQLLRERKEA